MSAVPHISTSSILLAITQSSRVHGDVWCGNGTGAITMVMRSAVATSRYDQIER